MEDLFGSSDDRDYSRSSSRGRSRQRRQRRRGRYQRKRTTHLATTPVRRWRGPITLTRDIYRNFIRSIQSLVLFVVKSAFIASFLTLFAIYSIIITIALYGVVYWFIIPPMYMEAPLHFDFDLNKNGQQSYFNCENLAREIEEQKLELPTAVVDFAHAENQWELLENVKVTTIVEKPSKSKKKQKRSKKSQNPSNATDKDSNTTQTQHKQSKQNIVVHEVKDWRTALPKPDADIQNIGFNLYRFLQKREKYDVYIYLGLRDSELNYGIGNIMVGVDLLTIQKHVLASSRRPTIVRRKKQTSFFYWFYTNSLLRYIPFWGGGQDENEFESHDEIVLRIHSFEKFMEQEEDILSVQGVRVQLSQPNLQLHHAKVAFLCQLEGIRYYMYHWQLTCFALYMSICLFLEGTSAIFTTTLAIIFNTYK